MSLPYEIPSKNEISRIKISKINSIPSENISLKLNANQALGSITERASSEALDTARKNLTETQCGIKSMTKRNIRNEIHRDRSDSISRMSATSIFTAIYANKFKEEFVDQVGIVDQLIGAPYIKLKINDLNNYELEPLVKFDQQQLDELDPAIHFRNGVDKAFSRFQINGIYEWRACEVLQYDPDIERFLIKWKYNDQLKQVVLLFNQISINLLIGIKIKSHVCK